METVVRYGFPVEEILSHEAREDIDLTAMSTHGRKVLARWVIGSVAESIIRHPPCPVLVLRGGQ